MKNPGENHPTIYDVAELSGLSISTISRVLNSPSRVNETTRAKVLQAIDQLGFVPKAEARARALQNNRRIGVLTPFFTSPSFVQRLRGIDAALIKTNYELIIYTVESTTRLQGYLATLPITGNLDGLIIMSLPFNELTAERLCKRGLPTVSIEYSQPNISSIVIDNLAGGKLAARHLIAKGHRRCAFLGDLFPPDYAVQPIISRLEGFRLGLDEAGIPLPDEYIRSSAIAQEPTQQVLRELFDLPVPPTAIFAAADVQAVTALRVAREIGLKVPGDLAVIGFDDLDLADLIGLTTIRQPLDDSGRIAAELLLAFLTDPGRPTQHINLPLSFIERGTA